MEIATEIDKKCAKIYFSWVSTIYLLNALKYGVDMQEAVDNMTEQELQDYIKNPEKTLLN